MEGEGLGDLVMCGDVMWTKGGHGGWGAKQPSVVHDARDSLMLNRNYCSQALPPVCLPSVYLDIHAHNQISRPSPSVFAYYRQSNTEGGNEAM